MVEEKVFGMAGYDSEQFSLDLLQVDERLRQVIQAVEKWWGAARMANEIKSTSIRPKEYLSMMIESVNSLGIGQLSSPMRY